MQTSIERRTQGAPPKEKLHLNFFSKMYFTSPGNCDGKEEDPTKDDEDASHDIAKGRNQSGRDPII
jgi:hypothetical protein